MRTPSGLSHEQTGSCSLFLQAIKRVAVGVETAYEEMGENSFRKGVTDVWLLTTKL